MQMLLDAGAGVDAKSNGRLDEKIEKRMRMGQRGRISWYFNDFMRIWMRTHLLDDVVDKNDTNEDDVLDVDFLRESRVLCQS